MCSIVFMLRLLLATASGVLVESLSLAQKITPQDLETRERDLTNLLQARLGTIQGERSVGNVRFTLGKGSTQAQEAARATTTTPQDLGIPANADAIPQAYWVNASKVLELSGLSTPIPSAATINAPPLPPTPQPWQAVMQEAQQPVNTKLGSVVIYGLTGPVTPTPPPKQAMIGQQFVAQCPMVLFEKNLSIRAPSCNETFGTWVDTNPLNTRTVLRWKPLGPAGLYFGVDSALTGPCSAEYAAMTERMTLTGYHFVLKNCLGIERWRVEETVFKVDNMGKVDSTMDLHDITMNSEAFFLKYLVKTPTGVVAAESNLFRMLSNQMNFTEVVDGHNTGKVLAVATRQGRWTKKGWEACMSSSSPRGWSLYFPQSATTHDTVATVQDIRVAIAGTITLMGYRNENRAKDGLNNEGSTREVYQFLGGIALLCIGIVLACNFNVVFRNSGLRDKMKKILFDAQGLLPKRPHQERTPPMHPTY